MNNDNAIFTEMKTHHRWVGKSEEEIIADINRIINEIEEGIGWFNPYPYPIELPLPPLPEMDSKYRMGIAF